MLSNEESLDLLNKTGNATPNTKAWGIATRDFSSGGFWWFKDFAALREFMIKALPTIEQDAETIEDFTALHKQYSLLLQNLETPALNFSELIRYHNNHFASDIELIWIGPYEVLVKADTNFAKFVRTAFNESGENIKVKDEADFREHIGIDVSYLGEYDQMDY
jgi:hypothetical protein